KRSEPNLEKVARDEQEGGAQDSRTDRPQRIGGDRLPAQSRTERPLSECNRDQTDRRHHPVHHRGDLEESDAGERRGFPPRVRPRGGGAGIRRGFGWGGRAHQGDSPGILITSPCATKGASGSRSAPGVPRRSSSARFSSVASG